jgi:hypothetical protein
VTVFDGFTHFLRAITSLAVLVPADDTEDEDVNKPPSTNRAQVNEKLWETRESWIGLTGRVDNEH